MHRVVVLAVPGVVPFELAVPGRLFGAAYALDGSPGYLDGTPLYSVRTCSIDGATVRTSGDYSICVEHDASALLDADTVVIPPSRDPSLWNELTGPMPDFVAALRSIPAGVRIMVLCTAAFAAAAAGLLDDRPVATHWREASRLQRLFPHLRVDADVLFVDDGDVLTSAGVVAAIDLCLHVIRADHGCEIANEVARACVVAPWRDGGQAQFIQRPVPPASVASTSQARSWALEHLDEPIVLNELAVRAAMSVRTFTRRFREEVGLSPGQWLTAQRVDRARDLLENTDLTIDDVAHRAGFGSPSSLRAHMTAVVGVSPQAYRQTFGAPLARAGSVRVQATPAIDHSESRQGWQAPLELVPGRPRRSEANRVR